jgi:hypothetical protein
VSYLLRSSIAPGSGLTLIPIEMVSVPSLPEAIEPHSKNKYLEAIKTIPALKGEALSCNGF